MSFFQANAWASCDVVGTAIQFPKLVMPPASAAMNSVIALAPISNSYFGCDVQPGAGFSVNLSGSIDSTLKRTNITVALNGISARVYETSAPGVGIAFAYKVQGSNNYQDFTDSTSPWVSSALLKYGFRYLSIAAALVKIGNIKGGTIPSVNATVSVTSAGTPIASGVFKTSPALTLPNTCSLISKAIDMGIAITNQFTRVGATAARKSFALEFNDCPTGANAIKYQVNPTSAILDRANGVIALDARSGSATGIGLQITDSTGTAVPFGTDITLPNYLSLAGGSYTVSLNAAFRQTGKSVTSGTASAAIVYTATYE